MKLYYFEHPNFGDALNPFLWQQLLSKGFDGEGRVLFVGTGTLLNDGIPQKPLKLVFGSGVGYGSAVPVPDARWKFYWVRGKYSARALGLDEAVGMGDGALLLRLLPLPPVRKENYVAFMPHWLDLRFWDWRAVCAGLGWYYVDPCAPVSKVIAELRAARLVVTAALHGAIVADAFRVPWIPVRAYKHVLAYKWQDWGSVMDLTYRPVNLPALYAASSIVARVKHSATPIPTSDPLRMGLEPFVQARNRVLVPRVTRTLARLADGSTAYLSQDATIERALERMQGQLAQFQRDRENNLFGT